MTLDIAQIGRIAPDTGAGPIDLRRDTIWRVEAGRVHVFAVPSRAGQQIAPRRYLFTVDAPGVLFGKGAGNNDLGLIAMPLPGSRVLVDEAFWDDTEQDIPAAVDQWVGGWFAAIGRYTSTRPPRRDTIEADRMELVLPADTVIDSHRQIVWFRTEGGDGVLFDQEAVGGIDGPAWFPLGPGGWLRTFDPMRVSTFDTPAMQRMGALRHCLPAFAALAERQVAATLKLAFVDEVQRLDRAAGRQSADMRRVMADLGRMVGAVPPGRALPSANQAWFHTLHVAAAPLGLRVQMPQSVREAEADVEVPMADILASSGLRARAIRLPPGWHRQALGDFVGTDAGTGAPLALLVERGGYVRRDPVAGTRARVTDAVADTVSPDAFVLYEPLPDSKVTMTQLCLFGLQGCRPDMAVMALAAALGAFAATLPAIGSQLILRDLIPQHLSGLLIQAGIALALVGLLRAVFNYTGNIAFARIRTRSSMRLKAALWDRLLRQPMQFLGRYTAPDLTLRCNTAEQIVMAVHQLCQQSLLTVSMLVINVATMFWLSRPAALAGLGLAGVYGLAIWFTFLGQKRAFRQGESAEGATSVFIHAITNGIRKIRLAGAEERAFVKWGERFSRSRLKLINVRRVTNLYLTFSAAFDVAAVAVVLAVLAVLSKDELPMGVLFGFLFAFSTVTQSLSAMGRAVTGVAFQFASIPYCQPVLDNAPPREARKGSPGRLTGALELSNIHFRYGDGEPVLQDVSLRVAPGEFIALVGPTGCGKSTVLKLLLGLEKPVGGAILYDERDLEGLDIDAVRRQIGTVAQRPALMQGTLFDVIRGIGTATDDAVWDAARMAGVAEDIDAMPMKLHTLVAEGAPGFSGGQIQRIAIARAIVQRPAILLMDEAASALDNRTQAAVSANLAHLSCTRIVVAHRLSTVVNADRIVVLDKGRIVEEGRYEDLLSQGGFFAAMAARQIADGAAG